MKNTQTRNRNNLYGHNISKVQIEKHTLLFEEIYTIGGKSNSIIIHPSRGKIICPASS